MTPNCEQCNDGHHAHCYVEWCECRGFHHAPSHLIGLARALGVDDDALRDTLSSHPHDQTWFVLLDQVRELNNRECNGHPVDKQTASVATLPDPPFLVRARHHLDEFAEIDTVTVDLTKGDVVQDMSGRDVHYRQEMTLTVTGRLT